MKEILPNIFAVEVPEDAKQCTIKNGTFVKWIMIDKSPFIPINEAGKFRTLFTTKDCTEEQAATLPMEDSGINFGYKDYEGKQSSHFYADHALLSLLRSRSLDPKNKNYLLLKKIS